MKGLVRIASAVPRVHIGNVAANIEEHIKLLHMAKERHASLVVFPELSLTGYTCADLFFQQTLQEDVEAGIAALCEECPADMTVVAGAPVKIGGSLYNCAVVIADGKVCGIVPKTYLPNTNEFYEKRWFESGRNTSASTAGRNAAPFGSLRFVSADGVSFGMEICEDLWSPLPPSMILSLSGCDIILNLSASNELIAKREYRQELIGQQSARCLCGYVYVSAGKSESTTDLIFSGHSLTASCGRILKENERYLEDDYVMICDIDIDKIRTDRVKSASFRDAEGFWKEKTESVREVCTGTPMFLSDTVQPEIKVPAHPFIPSDERTRAARCEQIFEMQASALARRLSVTGGKLTVGISGGLDSTLALLAACKAVDMMGLPRQNILAVTLPCFGTTDRTHDNAWELMRALGVTAKEVNIREAVRIHLRDIGHDEADHSVTYENAQARERTQVLMDLANDFGGIVLGTGDLSEIALGWCTYNADHMSMYGVNCGIPKTLVRWIIQTTADMEIFADAREVLLDILDTPISPELLPPDEKGNILQQTEDLVGPYELHDFFLYYAIRYGFRPKKIYELCRIAFDGVYEDEVIKKWIKNFYRRFFNQQFKRSCMPDGVKIGSIALSPRGDWRMPSDAESASWLRECEEL